MFATAPELEVLDAFDEPWRTSGHGPRLRAVRRAARGLRERFREGPRALSVRTLPITTLGYPTKYAFSGAAISPAPLVIMEHRAISVQFLTRGEPKTLLFNPTDPVAARETPFFARLIEEVGDAIAFRVIVREHPLLEVQLDALGLTPAAIDYVAFDHLHTQDLRGLLGTTDGARPPRFPNAKLLLPKREWDDWDDLHPMQRAWFHPHGKEGVITDSVVLTEQDLVLGDGVMLARTPGHTSGNQTLFVNTASGIWGVSENGVCADSWSPLESRIRGLRRTCRLQDLEVVQNANTPELGADQYTSMILERTLVDPVERAAGFCQMFPSSEVVRSRLAPGLTPTIMHEKIEHGTVVVI